MIFKEMELSESSGTVVLKKQLGLKEYSCRFLVYEGHYKFIITPLESKLRFNHIGYDPDGGTWSMPPGERQQEHYTLLPGQTYTIELNVLSHYGKLNRVEIVNPSMLSPASFNYEVIKA